MSEPAWAHLLFGGAYCYVRRFCSVELFNPELERVAQSCGAKPVTKILFSLRRRACKSCMKTQCVTISFRA